MKSKTQSTDFLSTHLAYSSLMIFKTENDQKQFN